MLIPETDLLPGERVVREEGVSRANLVFAMLMSLVIIVVAELFVTLIAALMAWLTGLGNPNGGSSGGFWASMPVLFLLVALAALVWQLLVALSARYTLTDRRLLTTRGVISRAMSHAELHRVQDVHVRQDFIGRVLNYGHVYVETAGASGVIAIKFVKDPASWARSLYESAQPAPVVYQGRGGTPLDPQSGWRP